MKGAKARHSCQENCLTASTLPEFPEGLCSPLLQGFASHFVLTDSKDFNERAMASPIFTYPTKHICFASHCTQPLPSMLLHGSNHHAGHVFRPAALLPFSSLIAPHPLIPPPSHPPTPSCPHPLIHPTPYALPTLAFRLPEHSTGFLASNLLALLLLSLPGSSSLSLG